MPDKESTIWELRNKLDRARVEIGVLTRRVRELEELPLQPTDPDVTHVLPSYGGTD